MLLESLSPSSTRDSIGQKGPMQHDTLHTNVLTLLIVPPKRLTLLIVLPESVINIRLTSYRLLHHSHRKALSLL
jgi:hypothetical protein